MMGGRVSGRDFGKLNVIHVHHNLQSTGCFIFYRMIQTLLYRDWNGNTVCSSMCEVTHAFIISENVSNERFRSS